MLNGRRITVIALAAVAVVAVVASIDPLGPAGRWLPKCPLHSLTGFDCPGCGTTRALHALLTGHPLEALGHNLFLPVAILMIAFTATAEAAPERFPRLHGLIFNPVTLYGFAFLTIFWWIARNIIGI